jgi:hypothetical protein
MKKLFGRLELQGNLTIQGGIFSQVDLAHAPFADFLQYAVVRYRLPFQAALRVLEVTDLL